MINSKQVIVMKKFPKALNMPVGKYVAQGAHACLGAVFKMGKLDEYGDNLIIPLYNTFVRDWVLGSFTKAVVYVETDEELVALHNAANAAGIPTSLITDSGRTIFKGEPTMTAVGIGPGGAEEIDKITGHLKLF